MMFAYFGVLANPNRVKYLLDYGKPTHTLRISIQIGHLMLTRKSVG